MKRFMIPLFAIAVVAFAAAPADAFLGMFRRVHRVNYVSHCSLATCGQPVQMLVTTPQAVQTVQTPPIQLQTIVPQSVIVRQPVIVQQRLRCRGVGGRCH